MGRQSPFRAFLAIGSFLAPLEIPPIAQRELLVGFTHLAADVPEIYLAVRRLVPSHG